MHPPCPTVPRPSRAVRAMRMARLMALGLPLVMLGACHNDQQQPTMTFAPLSYSNLAPLNLNVASISIVDRGQPGMVPGDLSNRAPTPPDQALRQMAHDRLIASGAGGHGVFTIDRASILHEPGGILDGQMNVHLDVVSADGLRKGYAVAQVTRSYDPKATKGNTDTTANLYELVNLMMQDMNRELESQIRNNLGNWLTTAPVAGAVSEQSLDGASPGTGGAQTVTMPMPNTTSSDTPAAVSSTPAATSNAPAAPAAPAANDGPDPIFPDGEPSATTTTTTTRTPRLRSPQPGYLTLPPSGTNSTSGTN
ncbi:hypothetical protein [Novacetimonas cocois]|uniref:Lipoprotein n=1 Tax=Novacetimonas cocois TaxID=1747507 RepID=A0A365YYM7_9PROT|nr:hypothetical protein [Novacetimonas cocois]RBM08519.1 hypothetical protein NJLHNGOC_03950 [Novacetimonas cocois]